MQLIDEIEAAPVTQRSGRPLDASMTLPIGTVLLIKAALEAGEEMATYVETAEHYIPLEIEHEAARFRAATEGAPAAEIGRAS